FVGVRVPKAGCTVVAGADAAIVSVPPPAAREPFRFVVLGSATRGPARLVVRGEGADAAEVELFDLAGRGAARGAGLVAATGVGGWGRAGRARARDGRARTACWTCRRCARASTWPARPTTARRRSAGSSSFASTFAFPEDPARPSPDGRAGSRSGSGYRLFVGG